jgi:putative DNA primase/helicase
VPDEEDEQPERTVNRGTEDDEQAEWLAAAFEQRIRYDHTGKRWHAWNGTRWAPDKTKQVQRDVMDMARERLFRVALDGNFTKTARDRLEKMYRKLLDVAATERALAALSTRPGYKTDGADWDQDPDLLGCENGIVDLRVNALVPNPTPAVLVTQSTGHEFIPFEPQSSDLFAEMERHLRELGFREPRFPSFLREITSGDVNLAAFYLLWFGYSLFGHTREQRFLILTGTGRNGKGALVAVMRYVFGEYSAKADQSLYMRSRWGSARSDQARADLMELKGKRLAVMSEPDGGVFNEELLKAHTGGDPITARALHSNNLITWEPTHSITFLTNEPPKVNDIGPAMSARVMVADFRERFDGEREDKRLYGSPKSKLESEAVGILGFLCWTAKWWNDSEHGLVLPERVAKASAEYLTNNDPIGRALDEAFVFDPAVQTPARMLYDAYVEWHARSDERDEALSSTAFGMLLVRRGLKKRQTAKYNVYLGIRPKTALEIADET